jgi:hypothetical protein
VRERLADRPRPLQAEVAVPRADRIARDEVADVGARAVDVEPLLSEGVREPAGAERNDFRAEDVPVERVRALPVRDCDDEVVEPKPLRG